MKNYYKFLIAIIIVCLLVWGAFVILKPQTFSLQSEGRDSSLTGALLKTQSGNSYLEVVSGRKEHAELTAGGASVVLEDYPNQNVPNPSTTITGYLQSDRFIAPTYSTAPSTAYSGEIYFNTTDKHFYGYNGASWVRLDNL